MKVDVYESIRFHALHKRRQHATTPARLMMVMAALALMIAGSAGVLHATAANDTAATNAHYAADPRK